MDFENNVIFTKEELQDRLTPVFQNYNVKQAVLFGSYGKGTATSKSDIDLLVDSGLKGLKFVGLINDIKTSLLDKDVDVFDISHINTGSLIEREIQDSGVLIYAK